MQLNLQSNLQRLKYLSILRKTARNQPDLYTKAIKEVKSEVKSQIDKIYRNRNQHTEEESQEKLARQNLKFAIQKRDQSFYQVSPELYLEFVNQSR